MVDLFMTFYLYLIIATISVLWKLFRIFTNEYENWASILGNAMI